MADCEVVDYAASRFHSSYCILSPTSMPNYFMKSMLICLALLVVVVSAVNKAGGQEPLRIQLLRKNTFEQNGTLISTRASHELAELKVKHSAGMVHGGCSTAAGTATTDEAPETPQVVNLVELQPGDDDYSLASNLNESYSNHKRVPHSSRSGNCCNMM